MTPPGLLLVRIKTSLYKRPQTVAHFVKGKNFTLLVIENLHFRFRCEYVQRNHKDKCLFQFVERAQLTKLEVENDKTASKCGEL